MIQFAEFAKFPGGSLRTQGDNSGQQFREEVLRGAVKQALERNGKVILNLDGTMGLSTAFSREAFGGLVSSDGFTVAELKRVLVLEGSEPATRVYVEEAWDYINHAPVQEAEQVH